MRKLKLGIIGFGNMGSSHVGNIMSGKTPNTELSALCDRDPERRKVFSDKYPDIPVFETAEELIGILEECRKLLKTQITI